MVLRDGGAQSEEYAKTLRLAHETGVVQSALRRNIQESFWDKEDAALRRIEDVLEDSIQLSGLTRRIFPLYSSAESASTSQLLRRQ
jgi:hypothetical protein